jgi:hypothetical protein
VNENAAQQADKDVLVHLDVPANFAISRADGDADGGIVDLHILVIKNGELIDVRRGRKTEVAENYDASFTVSMPPGIYDLVVLANAGAILEERDIYGLRGHIYKDEVLPELYVGLGSVELMDAELPIAMWNEQKSVNVAAVGALPVPLTRMLARVDVGVGSQSLSDGTWDGLDGEGNPIPFELSSVHLWKYPRYSSLAPYEDDVPAVVEGQQQVDYLDVAEGPFAFYAPEAAVRDAEADERMAVIVGGAYNGGAESFYRVDFMVGTELSDVLRNHLYQICIESVSGTGSPTPEEAYNSVATNITARIVPWNRVALEGLHFSGSNYFIIDKRDVMLQPLAGDVVEVTLNTNLPDFRFTMGDKKLAAGETLSTANYKYTLTVADDEKYLLTVESLAHNVSEAPTARLEEWTIEAANMRIRFMARQQWTDSYVSVANGGSSMLFPEGGTVPIEIISPLPVTVSTEQSAAWITGGDDATQTGGYYTASLSLAADAYAGTEDRSAVIVIRRQDKPAIYYTITQQAPYMRVLQTDIVIPRPESPQVVLTDVEVQTNILAGELTLTREPQSHTIMTIGEALHTFDTANPRNLKFTVASDFTGPPDPARITGLFTVAADAKYSLEPRTVELLAYAFPPTPVAPYILYWDAASATMAAGAWHTKGGEVTQANMLFFKFGSVVGFYNNNDPWAMDKIVFEPSATKATTYENIPAWSGSITNDGYISSPSYHTLTSVQTGRGDPCKLVGFTAAQVAAGSYDNQAWRLPTNNDNTAAGYTLVSGGVQAGSDNNTFLPLAGYRHTNGSSNGVSSGGQFWSSKGDGNGADIYGRHLAFSTSNIWPEQSYHAQLGIGVRCVPTDYVAPVLVHVSNTVPATISASQTVVSFTVNTNLKGWGVRAYKGTDNSGTAYSSTASGASMPPNVAAVSSTVSVTIPALATVGGSQSWTFYLYSTEFPDSEIKIDTWTQTGPAAALAHIATGTNLVASGTNVPVAATSYTIGASTNLQGWIVRVYSGVTLLASSSGHTPQTIDPLNTVNATASITVPENNSFAARTLSFRLYHAQTGELAEFASRTQSSYSGIWTYSSGVPATVAQGGGTVSIVANTNLQGWVARVYDGATKLNASDAASTPATIQPNAAVSSTGTVAVPAYTIVGGSRTLSYKKYHTQGGETALTQTSTQAGPAATWSTTIATTGNVGYAASTLSIPVTTNLVKASTAANENWVYRMYVAGTKTVETEYSGNQTISASIPANTASSSRTISFRVYHKNYNGGAEKEFATRTQAAAAMYSVTVTRNNTGYGTTNTSGGTYTHGQVVTITASPNAGYKFKNWTSNTTSITIANANSASTTMTVNGAGTVTANFEVSDPTNLVTPTAPYILYWDGTRMQVGASEHIGGVVTQSNILFFKFGSVVGFTNTSITDTWGTGDVKFNPPGGSYEANSTGYTNIPAWNGTSTTDGYISDPAYHKLDNVKAGRGDPCKLAGLTITDIANGHFDNKKYRLPTDQENKDQFSSGTTFSGARHIPGYGLNKSGVGFLPAAGDRSADGSTYRVYYGGSYWSSGPGSTTGGYRLYFDSSVGASSNGSAQYGLAVRCVPQ